MSRPGQCRPFNHQPEAVLSLNLRGSASQLGVSVFVDFGDKLLIFARAGRVYNP